MASIVDMVMDMVAGLVMLQSVFVGRVNRRELVRGLGWGWVLVLAFFTVPPPF